jgi:hypothetical protein
MSKHVETSQKTFGKKTKMLIRTLCPSAKTFKKIGTGVVVRNESGECVCTWHKQYLANGLLVIR